MTTAIPINPGQARFSPAVSSSLAQAGRAEAGSLWSNPGKFILDKGFTNTKTYNSILNWSDTTDFQKNSVSVFILFNLINRTWSQRTRTAIPMSARIYAAGLQFLQES